MLPLRGNIPLKFGDRNEAHRPDARDRQAPVVFLAL